MIPRENDLKEIGIYEYRIIPTSEIPFNPEIHKICEDNICRLDELVKPRLHKFLLLSNEGCKRCKNCTYPSVTCRQLQRLFPPLEGYGIHVAKLEINAGIKYMHGENIITYFGLLIYRD